MNNNPPHGLLPEYQSNFGSTPNLPETKGLLSLTLKGVRANLLLPEGCIAPGTIYRE